MKYAIGTILISPTGFKHKIIGIAPGDDLYYILENQQSWTDRLQMHLVKQIDLSPTWTKYIKEKPLKTTPAMLEDIRISVAGLREQASQMIIKADMLAVKIRTYRENP